MDEDRLSHLPDSLIHQIFKYVPIKNIVQTSVLSKRWKTLWTYLQCLEFRDIGNSACFQHFVDSVFILRKPWDIDTLRLKLPWYFDRNHVNVWIIYAIDHNVSVLDLEFFWFPNEYELPKRLFSCSSLKELRVAGCYGIIDFPVKTSLNRLKKLHLYYLEFSDVGLKNIIAGCPMIETLLMEVFSMTCSSEGEVDICSTSLKYLTIEHGLMYNVRFCTPNLICLYYESRFVDGVCFIDMSNLDDATISDGVSESPVDISVDALIKPVAKTKSLNLWGPWIEPAGDDRHCSCDLRGSYNPENAPKYPYLPFNCPRLKLIEIQCSDGTDVSNLLITLAENAVSKPKIQIEIL